MTLRLDKALVERGLLSGRERAQALIRAGGVAVNGKPVCKASIAVTPEDDIRLIGQDIPYVSRGGLKLEGALHSFPICLQGKICLDIGASTGGFTDCMLQNGAQKVWAVDVGHGQLAEKLCRDPRVVNREGTNIRTLTAQSIPDRIDFFSVDVSFISLRHVFPVLAVICPPGCSGVCLVKPQFEAGAACVGKKGVVRSPAVHRQVLEDVLTYAYAQGFYPAGLEVSPIQGPEGNIEFLLYLTRAEGVANGLANDFIKPNIAAVVQKAHAAAK